MSCHAPVRMQVSHISYTAKTRDGNTFHDDGHIRSRATYCPGSGPCLLFFGVCVHFTSCNYGQRDLLILYSLSNSAVSALPSMAMWLGFFFFPLLLPVNLLSAFYRCLTTPPLCCAYKSQVLKPFSRSLVSSHPHSL